MALRMTVKCMASELGAVGSPLEGRIEQDLQGPSRAACQSVTRL